ncbi:MAG TPA: ABC transporter, partial [Desulfobulbaceae bacterium]|nr:ABC transporter [Desulfobulbaceae bacterium]
MNKVVIDIEAVSFSYAARTILEDVNLTVFKNDAICLVGPNGGGKTTLVKLILGLLVPTSGTIKVLGDTPGAVSKKIGYVPQHVSYDPKFPISVLDVVLMGRLRRNLFCRYGGKDREWARAALAEVGLAD